MEVDKSNEQELQEITQSRGGRGREQESSQKLSGDNEGRTMHRDGLIPNMAEGCEV